MRLRLPALTLFVTLVTTFFVPAAFAQPHIRVPQASPRALAEETFGVTDVSVSYHRPSVNGRRIWGGLVPYDVIWRTGANENTTITFSTPVTVEGQPLAAGTYSFFLIPSRDQWTAVFNRFTGGWGTYSYDASEDVLRVKVTPQPADMQERLVYTFDDAKADALTLSLRWEKLRIPIKLGAETVKLTMSGIRNQLRNSNHWVSQAWTEAAGYAFRHGEPDAALEFINHSIDISADASNLRTKAAIVEKKGDAKTAAELRERAAALSPEIAPIIKAYQLMGAKKYDEAAAALNAQLAANPKSWRAWSTLGVVYANRGDAAKSKEAFDKAMALAGDQSERVEVQDDINGLEADKK